MNTLVTVVVNFVQNSKANKLMIEELLDSLHTHYPGLKVIVGVLKDIEIAENKFTNVQVKFFSFS